MKLLVWNVFLAVHINDSLNILGSHKDRHARIGQGNMVWKRSELLLIIHQLKDLPFYLETPKNCQGIKLR